MHFTGEQKAPAGSTWSWMHLPLLAPTHTQNITESAEVSWGKRCPQVKAGSRKPFVLHKGMYGYIKFTVSAQNCTQHWSIFALTLPGHDLTKPHNQWSELTLKHTAAFFYSSIGDAMCCNTHIWHLLHLRNSNLAHRRVLLTLTQHTAVSISYYSHISSRENHKHLHRAPKTEGESHPCIVNTFFCVDRKFPCVLMCTNQCRESSYRFGKFRFACSCVHHVYNSDWCSCEEKQGVGRCSDVWLFLLKFKAASVKVSSIHLTAEKNINIF